MLTEQNIRDLFQLPKVITTKTPARDYREENGQRRCDLTLVGASDANLEFSVFVRQHLRFTNNFSIGLRCAVNQGNLTTITLLRYNGAHGETSRSRDGHFAIPHIHFITEDEMAAGHTQPQETLRELTDRYHTFEDALRVFFMDTAVSNYTEYFPELQQGRLFNGH